MKKSKSWKAMTTKKQRVRWRYGERNGTKGSCYSPNSKYARNNVNYTLALVGGRYGKTD